jgi:hypothetical protein
VVEDECVRPGLHIVSGRHVQAEEGQPLGGQDGPALVPRCIAQEDGDRFPLGLICRLKLEGIRQQQPDIVPTGKQDSRARHQAGLLHLIPTDEPAPDVDSMDARRQRRERQRVIEADVRCDPALQLLIDGGETRNQIEAQGLLVQGAQDLLLSARSVEV